MSAPRFVGRGRELAGLARALAAPPAGYATRSDAQGHYDLSVVPGSYDVSAGAFRYPSVTRSATVADGQTTTLDFALTSVPSATVSGAVTDGSGHGWPLYAKITIDGYPDGPIFTDPSTGGYSVQLPQGNDYTLHIAAMYGGYLTQQTQIHVGTADLRQDISTKVDQTACNAPGYGWNGLNTTFTRWTGGTTAEGWSVSGGAASWRFDDPGNRPAPPGGDDRFATADSAFYGSTRLDTTLTSPAIDLGQQARPVLSFDGSYYAATRGTVAEVELSIDGGHHWAPVWKHTTTNGIGHVDIQIPQAAGKSRVRVRFHFAGKGGWWWAVDNVSVGTHECVPTSGGLLVGTVTDKTTGRGIDGATVTSAAGLDATGIASATEDNAIRDGFYYLFTPQAGSQQVTAAATGYISDTAGIDVAADRVTRHDWALTAQGGNG